MVEAVPTAAQRRGDFSDLLAIGSQYQIYDPYSTTPAAGGLFTRTPVPNNVIPANRINPVSAKIASLWDAPNQPGTVDGTNNYTMGKNAQDTYGNDLVRFDHNVSEKERFYVRGNLTNLQRPGEHPAEPHRRRQFLPLQSRLSADDVYMVSPRFFVDSRFTLTRFYTGYTPYQEGLDLAGLGFSSQYVNQMKGLPASSLKFPNINVSGYSPLGGVNSDNRQTYNTYEAAVNVTNVFGEHTLRSGVAWRVYQRQQFRPRQFVGQLHVRFHVHARVEHFSLGADGPGLRQFLYGLPASGSFPINDNYAEQTRYWAFFSQDDWKVSSKLTLSLGLRYEMPSPLTERYNRSVQAFDPTAALSIAPQVLQNYAQNPIPQVSRQPVPRERRPDVPGRGRRVAQSLESREEPVHAALRLRLFADSEDRAARRLWHLLRTAGRNQHQREPDRLQLVDRVRRHGRQRPDLYRESDESVPRRLYARIGRGGRRIDIPGTERQLLQPDSINPYMQRWQFAVQQQLPGKSLLEVSYVGNRGTRMQATQDLNPTPRQYLSTSPVRDQSAINLLNAQVANPFYPLLPKTNLASTTVARSQLLRPYPQFSGITAS